MNWTCPNGKASTWTVVELSAFYTEQSSGPIAHAGLDFKEFARTIEIKRVGS
jgi:hypothetical protein